MMLMGKARFKKRHILPYLLCCSKHDEKYMMRNASCLGCISFSVDLRSKLTWLSVLTTINGPKGVGAGNPRISAMKLADNYLSHAAIIV